MASRLGSDSWTPSAMVPYLFTALIHSVLFCWCLTHVLRLLANLRRVSCVFGLQLLFLGYWCLVVRCVAYLRPEDLWLYPSFFSGIRRRLTCFRPVGFVFILRRETFDVCPVVYLIIKSFDESSAFDFLLARDPLTSLCHLHHLLYWRIPCDFQVHWIFLWEDQGCLMYPWPIPNDTLLTNQEMFWWISG